jgi:tRNA U34 2-thiouridine synthase MnmA/TrmU
MDNGHSAIKAQHSVAIQHLNQTKIRHKQERYFINKIPSCDYDIITFPLGNTINEMDE